MNSERKYDAHTIFQEMRGNLLPYYGEESEMLSYILLEFFLKIERKDCIAHRTFSLDEAVFLKLDQAKERLKQYEPIQYITGISHFFGRDFMVRPGVLIPRQETEELILLIKNKNCLEEPLIMDIGCGSGCIAVTLALEINNSRVYALDKFEKGVELTSKNSHKLGASVGVFQHDIYTDNWPFPEFDLLVSNPPYITESEKLRMKPNVLNYEPGEALYVPDDNPTMFYQRILEISEQALKPGGMIFFEINEAYGNEIKSLLCSGGFKQVEVLKDMQGKDRFAFGRKSS
jgi:release factor glutamine methyltransferase